MSAPAAPPSQAASGRPRAGRVALAVYIATVVAYGAFANQRLLVRSPDNHFAYLADSFLHGTLAVRCDRRVTRGEVCPPGSGGNDWARYRDRWYVAFPPFPGVVYMPAVALLGRNFPDRALATLLAGLAPALLYLLLERLARKGYADRTWKEDLAFTALFAFGTVYFFTAVQGTVWFVAHVIACALLAAYLALALEAGHPLWAGVLLGLGYLTRPPTLLAGIFFGMEALRHFRRADVPAVVDADPAWRRRLAWLRGVDWKRTVRAVAIFLVPVLVALAVQAWLNQARFGAWNETGYRYLQIRWQPRILRWGLFNYHYLSRNLAVVLALLPWISRSAPFVQVSRHGLALWVTSPHYLELARPARTSALAWGLGLGAAAIALLDLLYQNTGWIQFGYRFSNDYAVLLVALLALVGRPVRRGWLLVLALAIAVNTFGAVTFDRVGNVLEGDNTPGGMFQPD